MGLWVLLASAGLASGQLAMPEEEPFPMERLVKRQSSFGLNTTWGPYVDLGYTRNPKAFITYMSTIYSVGYPPSEHKGTTFLWPGVWDPRNMMTADLIQSVAEYQPTTKMRGICNPKPGEWCMRPFCVAYSRQPLSQYPMQGKAIGPTDKIQIEYIKKPGDDGTWTQKITNLSRGQQVLFNWERCNKPASLLRLATEYQKDNTIGTADYQHYWNTTVIFDKADPGLAGPTTFRTTGAIQATRPKTSDGGKTWIIEHVTIPPKSNGAPVVGKVGGPVALKESQDSRVKLS